MIGHKQAATLLQLSAGYVVMRKGDPYKALRARGLVADSTSYEMGGVEFERTNGKAWPTLTSKGRDELRRYVEKNGRLEVEMRQPLAMHSTVIRLDPVAFDEKGER